MMFKIMTIFNQYQINSGACPIPSPTCHWFFGNVRLNTSVLSGTGEPLQELSSLTRRKSGDFIVGWQINVCMIVLKYTFLSKLCHSLLIVFLSSLIIWSHNFYWSLLPVYYQHQHNHSLIWIIIMIFVISAASHYILHENDIRDNVSEQP